MTSPLIAVRRLRADTGGVVLPGCPIPGSDKWSKDVRARRIKQGFAKEGPKVKAKKNKGAKATAKAAEKE